jgi:GNAT superfamily N-acetyltransferase
MDIRSLGMSLPVRDALSDILVEVVADGGSVSFMHPLAVDAAARFWNQSLAAAERGERIVLGIFDGDVLAGTVTVILDCPPNQPHRAEIAKLMVRPDYRGRGYARALLIEAEARAAAAGRSGPDAAGTGYRH